MENIAYYTDIFTHHYRMIVCQSTNGTGIEPIRNSYKKMFGLGTGLFDTVNTPINTPNNPIDRLITFIGPVEETIEKKELEYMPSGIMPSNSEIVYVNFIDGSKVYDKDNLYIHAEELLLDMYYTIKEVISNDIMYKRNDKLAIGHPYLEIMKFLPFYITWSHFREHSYIYRLSSDLDTFKYILEKDLVNGMENIELLLSEFNNRTLFGIISPEDLYSIITVKGQIKDSILR